MLRKIKTREETARVKKRNRIIIGVVLVGLMILSSLGYSFISGLEDKKQVVTEEGVKFYRDGGRWIADYGGMTLTVQYLPSEVINVSVEGDNYSIADYSQNTLYLVSPNEGATEILTNINTLVLRYQEACYSENCTGDFPIKNCGSNLIIFNPQEETGVIKNQSCVFINGDPLMASDAFIYKILNII